MDKEASIRSYVISNLFALARAEGKTQLTIRAGDVHQAMDLEGYLPTVCAVLAASSMASDAGVRLIRSDGKANSADTQFVFEILGNTFGVSVAEARLRTRYGSPDSDTQKMISFKLQDGRSIALQRDVAQVQIWIEADYRSGMPVVAGSVSYLAEQGRHSNLPSRLRHSPPAELREIGFPKPVLSVHISDEQMLRLFLDWYDAVGGLDRRALDRLKAKFLEQFPDFELVGFGAETGRYFDSERAYKQKMIADTQALVENKALSEFDQGKALLDAVCSKDANFFGWRTNGRLQALRKSHPNIIEAAVGHLVNSDLSPDMAAVRFLDVVWPIIAEGQEKSLPYSESRSLPSILLAFAKPDEAIAINTAPFLRMGERLQHRQIFSNGKMTSSEYSEALLLAKEIFRIMRDEWKWSPRDLWDVQGFIWLTCRDEAGGVTTNSLNTEGAKMQEMRPTNLILYGPPGTGKTFETASEAVLLCDGHVPPTRSELMNRYRELLLRRRIAFVTFHQSYSYEDFVEGLRPDTGSGDGVEEGASQSGGFSLHPRPGIFRQIADLARDNQGTSTDPIKLDTTRQVFKVALGARAAEEGESYFLNATNSGYIAMGWGGDVDWSSPEYGAFEPIKHRWQQDFPEATGKAAAVEIVYTFRAAMKPGDYVIVSDGRDRFRAIGVIAGDYYFDQEADYHRHRRKVKWLWQSREGQPRDLIYGRRFRSHTTYRLDSAILNWSAMEQLCHGQENTLNPGTPEPYVLVIDEINRANISKVFGELITLIEPDKRLGNENALTVILPYSGDSFGVPANLHIVGTMNTADRSIALLDTALRRRFQFRELMPRYDLLPNDLDGINVGGLLKTINDRIEYLFDRDHQIGHAYFIGCATQAELDDVMRMKVIPLLAEYFYENWEKVRQALGETTDEGGFVSRSRLASPIGSDGEYGSERWRYAVRDSFEMSAYRQVGA